MNRTGWGRAAVGVLIVALAVGGTWMMIVRGEGPSSSVATGADDMAGMDMSDGTVHLDVAMARSLGVTSVPAELTQLDRSIRATGTVVFDETRLHTITPKVGGFVEQLYVDFTGQEVSRGEPLLEIYAPELVAAQEELLGALRMQEQLRASAAPAVVERAGGLVDAARRRLLLWDVSEEQVREIERTGNARRTLTLHSPFSGFVTEKMVQAGESVEAGMVLYRLADLSSVWVEADIYEQDLRFVSGGQRVTVELPAYPGGAVEGRVSYIHPEVSLATRTLKVRVAMANPGGRIKPGMYATVRIDVPVAERALVVPRDAVMYSGTHAMVFVEEGPGVYRVREVTVGGEVGGRTQILSGLLAGERVVSRANFLIDSESRLMEGMGSMPGMEH